MDGWKDGNLEKTQTADWKRSREETWEPHNNLGHFGIWLTWRNAVRPHRTTGRVNTPKTSATQRLKGRTACLPLVSQTSKENQLRSTHGRKNGRHQVSFHQRMPNYAHSVNWPAVTVAAGRRFGKSHLQLQKVHLRF